MINMQGLQKMLYAVVTFLASFLVLFFNLLFSKHGFKILGTVF